MDGILAGVRELNEGLLCDFSERLLAAVRDELLIIPFGSTRTRRSMTKGRRATSPGDEGNAMTGCPSEVTTSPSRKHRADFQLGQFCHPIAVGIKTDMSHAQSGELTPPTTPPSTAAEIARIKGRTKTYAKPAASDAASTECTPHDSEWRSELWTVGETDWLLAPPGPTDPATPTRVSTKVTSNQIVRDTALSFLHSWAFDVTSSIFVMANALLIGVETQLAATSHGDPPPHWLRVTDHIVFCVFVVELAAKSVAFGCDFFMVSGWQWNVFDLLVVGVQLLEGMTRSIVDSEPHVSTSFLRILRLLRLVRLTRLIRLVRVIEELRTIVTSLVSSIKPLLWTVVLLFLIIYTLAVCITQAVIERTLVVDGPEDVPGIDARFGTVVCTFLTLWESISNGIDWDLALTPLWAVSPLLGLLYCMYIAFSLFALTNVITGVFVERALLCATRDKEEYMANHLSSILYKDSTKGITLSEFKHLMNTQELREYFRDVGVDSSDNESLFQLLDTDGSGDVDPVEFLSSCLRLRGPAKSIELARHMLDASRAWAWTEDHVLFLEEQVDRIGRMLAVVADGMRVDLGTETEPAFPRPRLLRFRRVIENPLHG